MAQGSGKTPSCSQRGQRPAVSWEESLVNASFRELQSANPGERAELLQARRLCVLKTGSRQLGKLPLPLDHHPEKQMYARGCRPCKAEFPLVDSLSDGNVSLSTAALLY